MIFYIVDTTVKFDQEKKFHTYQGVVKYLAGMSQRAYGKTIKDRQILLEEMGHGTDDRNATLFVRSMQEQFNIGVIREGRKIRCDITAINAFQSSEFGD
jgi:hypothetical protein